VEKWRDIWEECCARLFNRRCSRIIDTGWVLHRSVQRVFRFPNIIDMTQKTRAARMKKYYQGVPIFSQRSKKILFCGEYIETPPFSHKPRKKLLKP